MDTETGRVEGYRVSEGATRRESYLSENAIPAGERAFLFSAAYAVIGSGSRWVEVTREDGAVRFLLDRATGRSWRLGGYLDLRDASADRLLWNVAGTAIVTGDGFAEVARLEQRLPPLGRLSEHSPGAGAWTARQSSTTLWGNWLRAEDRLPVAHLSLDGRRLLFAEGVLAEEGGLARVGRVSAWEVETSEQTLLFEPRSHEQWGEPVGVWAGPAPGRGEIRVAVDYEEGTREWYRLNWAGEVLARAASPRRHWIERPSPDLSYVAWWDRRRAWPAVVVADAASHEPLLRVRSAALQDLAGGDWLASGDGMVLWGGAEANDRGWAVIARIRPEPGLEWVPRLPDEWSPGFPRGLLPWRREEAMVTVATGSDRFFAGRYRVFGDDSEEGRGGVALYDAHSGRWHLAEIRTHQPESDTYGDPLFYLYPFWPEDAGERELVMVVGTHIFRGGGPMVLNRTALEFPPFPEELAFRVARTGSCLRVRAGPGEWGAIVDCLPDGTRVVVSGGPFNPDQISVVEWVHVRTESGREGWVGHRFLDHD